MASQAFLDRWREGGGALRHLVLLTAARDDGSQSDTIYLADCDTATLADVVPGLATGHKWQDGVIGFKPLHCPGSFATTTVELCTCEVVLNADVDVLLPAGAGTQLDIKLREMLRHHVLLNATVQIIRLFEGLNAAGDAQKLGPFKVIQTELRGGELTLQLRQTTDWNKPVAPRYVTKQDYPRAPEDEAGTPIPIIYGNNRPRPLRRPWGIRYLTQPAYGGMSHGVSRAPFVDTGRITAGQNSQLKILAAGHKCAAIGETLSDAGIYIEAGELLAYRSGGTIVNSLTECGFTSPPNWSTIFEVLLPVNEVLAPGNSAYNAAHLLARSDSQFALLDQTAGYRELQVRVPSLPADLGTPSLLSATIFYRSSGTLTGLKYGLYSDALAQLGLGPFTVAASTFPIQNIDLIATWSSWVSPFPTSPWAFSVDRIVRVFFDQAASPAGWCRVFAVGLTVTFGPKQQVVQTAKTREQFVGLEPIRARSKVGRRVYATVTLEPAVTETRGKFWANVRGLKDDGSGTYTGTASALIQRAPDILRHMFVTYGAVAAADIETGAATFGSLIAARADLVDEQGRDLVFGYPITTPVDVMTMLGHIGESALAMPMISPYDGKWRLVVWKDSPPVTYPWKFSRWDILEELGPEVLQTALPDIVTGVRVSYGYDGRRGSSTEECVLGHDRSTGGYLYFGLRDQYMTVVAGMNDRLDFKPSGGSALAANLLPEDYTVQSFCEHLRTQMNSAVGAGSERFLVGQGGSIKIGHNDRLSYNEGGAASYVGLLDGSGYGITGGQAPHASMKALCDAAMDVLDYGTARAGTHPASGRVLTMTDGQRTRGLRPGMAPAGTGIPAGSVIVSVDHAAGTVTIDQDLTASFTGTYTFTKNRTVSFGSGVAIVTMDDTAGLSRGMGAVHSSFPIGSKILTVDSSTQITLDNNSTGAGSGVAMEFNSGGGGSGGWVIDYDTQGTDTNIGKVTVTKLSGTRNIVAGASATAAERAESGWASLGFTQILGNLAIPASPTVLTAHDDRFVGHLWIQSLHSVTDYLFQSGANGQDSATAVRHCGELLGATAFADIVGSDSTHGSVCFLCPKGIREQVLKKSADRYGARKELRLDARAIYETDSALALRNRAADLFGKPRVPIRFSTNMAPDIERGHVFEFWPDMDDFKYPGLGSDGKWSGKRFVVVEVSHSLGPLSRSTTIVSVEIGRSSPLGWDLAWAVDWLL